MNRTRLWIAALLLSACGFSYAQSSFYRVAYLRAEKPPPEYIDALRDGLRDQGYIDGKNLGLQVRWANGSEEELRSIVREFVRLKFDVIVASAPAATRAAMDVTSSVPIVMVVVADPVNFKFVASLARPGGNVTGFAYLLPELSASACRSSRKPFRSYRAWRCSGTSRIPISPSI